LWNSVEMKALKLDYFTKVTKIYIFQKMLLLYSAVTYSFGGTSAKIPFVNLGRSAKSPYVEISKKQWVFQRSE
jgi:hypothetical protein